MPRQYPADQRECVGVREAYGHPPRVWAGIERLCAHRPGGAARRGPDPRLAARQPAALEADRDRFLDDLTRDLYTAGDELTVSEDVRRATLESCKRSGAIAAPRTLAAHDTTDFRADVAKVAVPALVLHGDADRRVPFEGSGRRTHEGSELALVTGGPHGVTVSHPHEVNRALLAFPEGAAVSVGAGSGRAAEPAQVRPEE